MNRIMIFAGFFIILIGFANFQNFQSFGGIEGQVIGSTVFWNLVVWLGFGIIGIGIGKSDKNHGGHNSALSHGTEDLH
ncbi:Uncharacterised protein [uncultured archaeon]|nr:Uncharacterised protein [uncultured archaeon]